MQLEIGEQSTALIGISSAEVTRDCGDEEEGNDEPFITPAGGEREEMLLSDVVHQQAISARNPPLQQLDLLDFDLIERDPLQSLKEESDIEAEEEDQETLAAVINGPPEEEEQQQTENRDLPQFIISTFKQ